MNTNPGLRIPPRPKCVWQGAKDSLGDDVTFTNEAGVHCFVSFDDQEVFQCLGIDLESGQESTLAVAVDRPCKLKVHRGADSEHVLYAPPEVVMIPQ